PATKTARALRIISGSMPITVEKGSSPITLCDDLTKAQGRKVSLPKATVTITLFFESPAHDEYKVYMTREKRGSDDVNADLQKAFELLDASGKCYLCTSVGFSSSGGPEDKVELGFVPPFNAAVGPATKLVYISRETLPYNVPFEFKDLPLP